jgi:hypothetical protein
MRVNITVESYIHGDVSVEIDKGESVSSTLDTLSEILDEAVYRIRLAYELPIPQPLPEKEV